MRPETNVRERMTRAIFIMLALLVPALVGFVTYSQWSAPALDCVLNWQTGVVLNVAQDSFANYAGLMPGDTLLNVNGIPFAEWKSLAVENQPVEIQRGTQRLMLELPIIPLAQANFPFLLSTVVVVLAFWGIGTFLFWRSFRQLAARLFFLMVQTAAIGLLFFLAYPETVHRPQWMEALSVLGFHLAGALLVHYYLTFPVVLGSPRQRRLVLTLVYGLMLVALACRLSFTPLGIRLSFLYNTTEIIGAVAILIYAYLRRATPDGRRRLRLIVFGGMISATPPFFFYLLPTIAGSSFRMPGWLVGPFIVVSPLSYFLAIVRHNLFNIDRVLNRTIVYAILSLGILSLYLGPFLLLYRFMPEDWLAQVFTVAGLTLLVGLSFDWTRTRVQRFVDRFFYGGWYDYPGVIETISDALARCIELGQLTDVLTRQVPALMQLNAGQFLISDKWQVGKIKSDGNSPAIYPSPSPVTHHSAQSLPQLQFPLTFQNQTRARWTVGARRDGEDFSDADHRILTTIARQAETALGNVLLIETLRTQIDEIRASRETLAQAQWQLLRSREDERARLARDLHDGPIQDLVGLNMQLGLLLADLANQDLSSLLTTMRAQVRALLGELRQVCTELRPPMLDTLGLGAALRAHAEEWSAQNNIAVQLDLPPDAALRALPGEVAVNLYRVAQEALINVARHAAARHVGLYLAFEDSRLALTIHDDGRGFVAPAQLQKLTAHGHFGLVGMRERVELIRGTLAVESAPGNGTTICVAWQGDSRVA